MAAAAVEITRHTQWHELPQWLSAHEVAAYLDCSTWTIYQNIHRGLIPYRRIGPKVLQVPKEFFHPNRAQQQVTP